MKKQSLIAIVLIVMVMTLASLAALASPVIVRFKKGDETKTLGLQLANLHGRHTEIRLQDVSGKIWFAETLRGQNGWFKKLVLTELPAGTYVCFVRHHDGISFQPLVVGAADIAFFTAPATAPAAEPSAQLVDLEGGQHGRTVLRTTPAGISSFAIYLHNLHQRRTTIQINALGEGVALRQVVRDEDRYAKRINCAGMLPGDYFVYLQCGQNALMQALTVTAEGIALGSALRFEGPMLEPAEKFVGH
jgi:hypothetical protein